MDRFIAHYRKADDTPQYVTTHLTETAALCEMHMAELGLPLMGWLLGVLHDTGKLRERFQIYISQQTGLLAVDPESKDVDQRGDVDHSSAGGQIIFRHLPNHDAVERFFRQLMALVICSHHSGLVDCLTIDGKDNFTRKMEKSDEQTGTNESWSNVPDSLKNKILEVFNSETLQAQNLEVFKKLQKGLLLEMKDDTTNIMFKQGLFARFAFSCLIDADRENTADFEFERNHMYRSHAEQPNWAALAERLEKHLLTFTSDSPVNRQRKAVSDACFSAACKPRGIYRLTIPTGGGKTLASLRFALQHACLQSTEEHPIKRIFYFLPFTTIIEQDSEEIRKILESGTDSLHPVVLEHHSNLLPEKETEWSKVVSENFDGTIVMTSMVQFLEAAFGSGTRSARRFHTFANSVLIFDEIQAIPTRCIHMFNLLVRFLTEVCGSTVILCTATQPSLDDNLHAARRLPTGEDVEIYKDRNELFAALKRVNVEVIEQPQSFEEIRKLTLQQLDEYESVLVVVNRKDSASKLFEMLQQTPDTKVVHLTTGMCAAHRMEVLNEIRPLLRVGTKQRVICISTSLIEAGVDISFGSAIRFLAGLDSIAQTAGRVNRHGEREQGILRVVQMENEDLSCLKHIDKGAKVSLFVHTKIQKRPDAFPNGYLGVEAQKCYSDHLLGNAQNEDAMDYRVNEKSPFGRVDNLFRAFSSNGYSENRYKSSHDGIRPTLPLKQSFAAASEVFQAIDAYAIGVLAPHGYGKELIASLSMTDVITSKTYILLREAQRYLVNIPRHKLQSYLQEGVVYMVNSELELYALNSNTYHDTIGFSTEIYSNSESFFQ